MRGRAGSALGTSIMVPLEPFEPFEPCWVILIDAPTKGPNPPSDIRVMSLRKPTYLIAAAALAGIAVAGLSLRARSTEQSATATPATTAVKRGDFVRTVRLAGTVEAVQATSIIAPRLSGQNPNSLVIMRLIKAGATVKPGDPLVEFDRQEQLRNALDRRAELVDLEQQIKKREAEEVAARATDDSTLKQAESTLEKA